MGRLTRRFNGRFANSLRTIYKSIMMRLQIRRWRSIELNRSIRVQAPRDTLETVRSRLSKRKRCVYFRFGDGELSLILGRSGRNHTASPELSSEMRECFMMSGEDIIKCLPIHSHKYGYETHMRPGVHLWSDRRSDFTLLNCYQYFIGSQIYSPIALHYTIIYDSTKAIEFFRNLRAFEPIFVGNSTNQPAILERLLNATTFIPTPSSDAYKQIDEIESQVAAALDARGRDYDVVVLSCGSAAKVLMRRLYNSGRNLFLFDIGSVIDLFHGRTKWSWVELSGVEPQYWAEFIQKVSLEQHDDQNTPLAG